MTTFEARAWSVIAEYEEESSLGDDPDYVLATMFGEYHQLFLGETFIRRAKEKRQEYNFFSHPVLSLIAKDSKSDHIIPPLPGVYIFTNIRQSRIDKIGHTGNLQERITRGHLRYGNGDDKSNMIDHYRSTWPNRLEADEIGLFVFPILRSTELQRRLIEEGLMTFLGTLCKPTLK